MNRLTLMILCLAGCSAVPSPAPVATPAAPPETPLRQDADVQRYHATELRPGDCVEPLPETFLVTVVPCDAPHSAEFATTYVLPDGPYPGADMARLVENGCLPRMRIKESEKDEVGLYWLSPAPEDWPRGRTAYCLAAPLDGGKTTGRVVK